jgi:hypothetical protein
MTSIPKDGKADGRSASDGATAMDYVRTKQEAEAEVAKRDAEAKLGSRAQAGEGAPRPVSKVSKDRADATEDPLQNTTDEPIVEDEP